MPLWPRTLPVLLLFAAPLLAEPPVDANALIRRDFAAFDPNYAADFRARAVRIGGLKAALLAQTAQGVQNPVANQVLFEAGTLLFTTADFKRIDRRTDDLAAAIAHPALDRPDADGMWGSGSEQWFLKLDNTFDRLTDEARHGADGPPRPLPAFLDRVATPAKLEAWLDAVAVSDIPHTGINHGLELNLAISDLLRIIVLGEPEDFRINPELRDAFLRLLKDKYRDPATGFWGERFRRNGEVKFQPDISTTFHIVSYLKGRVPDMPRVAETMLSLKNFSDPAGWLSYGHYWNHNNLDVVTVFQYAWPEASPAQRQAMAVEIDGMLSWCLRESLQPDGSFRVQVGDLSQEYAENFGVEFLVRIGFFSPARCFWTDRSFPQSEAIRTKIRAFIEAHAHTGVSGDNYASALSALINP
jgi:hypothetical protein